ncbi:hypothetical protein C8R41DRAFT_868584 [Lentinula lateritia]|uniref:BZIP domain-containing protein n=1 Tax=Lentinula lateritia TaxID=40482 RepID=A0ABQ8VAI9_9AGAR|nr:hypothetical protein C8R41DRAFT_868584 [Lentinula lateritia]
MFIKTKEDEVIEFQRKRARPSSLTYEGSEPSKSQTPVTSKKRKKPEYSNSEGANDMDNVRDEEENASARDSMQLRLPSASGRERISLCLEDLQIETQRWVEGMHRFNEHKHFRIKSPQPKIVSDESQSEDADALDTVAFSQMAPPGWFGGLGKDDDVDVKLEDEPETADLECKNVRRASKSLHVGKIGILRKRNQMLQARLNIASQGLSDANAKNTQLAHLLCESRTHNREVTDELSRTADELAQANARIQQMEEQLYSQNKIFAHVGTIFTSLSLSSEGSEADIFCDTLGAHLNNEYRETQ